MSDKITSEFIKDVWEYYNSFSEIELRGQSPEDAILNFYAYNFKDDFDIAYFLLSRDQLLKLYKFGVEDYGIDFCYNTFVKYFIGTKSLPRHYRRFRWYNSFRQKSTKYQKASHHKKKEIDDHTQAKINWRIEKGYYKDKTKVHYKRRYYYDWYYRKSHYLEAISEREFQDELDEYMCSH